MYTDIYICLLVFYGDIQSVLDVSYSGHQEKTLPDHGYFTGSVPLISRPVGSYGEGGTTPL